MFQVIFEEPLYNTLILLMKAFPFLDLGMIIIVFTILVKFVLAPLSLKALKSQNELKALEPELKKLKEKYTSREELGMKTLELYKEHKINPFASIGLILIQLPILFALYFVFLRSGLPEINLDLLYGFISAPSHQVSILFFGLIDITQKSLPLALIAGVFQFIQTRYTLSHQPHVDSDEKSFATDFAKSMNFQMKYVFPIIIVFISYTLSAAAAIYFAVSSLFQLGQEVYFRRSSPSSKK